MDLMAAYFRDRSTSAAASSDSSVPAEPPRQKRAYHRKVRTGCITCKIRRVRCGEEKPACKRCTSTGRKCDGFEPVLPKGSKNRSSKASISADVKVAAKSGSKTPYSPRISHDLRLMMPSADNAQLRSFTYFLEVTAPSLAGFFDANFWLDEIPRACQYDPAIWHATVCLGAVAERHGARPEKEDENIDLFALQQFNEAVRFITDHRNPCQMDGWRAVTASTIFTYICTIQGLYKEARVHLDTGCKLLRELQEEDIAIDPMLSLAPQTLTLGSPCPGPVDMDSLAAILLRMELQKNALDHGAFQGSSPSAKILESDIFLTWQTYEAPIASSIAPRCLTPINVYHATRAAESLVYAMSLSIQEHMREVAEMRTDLVDSEARHAMLVAKQASYTSVFLELQRAIRQFVDDLKKPWTSSQHGEPSKEQMRKAILPLRNFHLTCRMILVEDPDVLDPVERQRTMPTVARCIIDNSEEILGCDGTMLEVYGKKVPFTPNSSTLNALFVVSQGAFTLAIRKKAVEILRRPAVEGLWDTYMSAKLADAIIEREVDVLNAHRHGEWVAQLMESDAEPKPGALQNKAKDEEEVPFLFRARSVTIDFVGRREAVAKVQTWAEWMGGPPGKGALVRC